MMMEPCQPYANIKRDCTAQPESDIKEVQPGIYSTLERGTIKILTAPKKPFQKFLLRTFVTIPKLLQRTFENRKPFLD